MEREGVLRGDGCRQIGIVEMKLWEGRTPERGSFLGLQFRSPEREVLRLLINVMQIYTIFI